MYRNKKDGAIAHRSRSAATIAIIALFTGGCVGHNPQRHDIERALANWHRPTAMPPLEQSSRALNRSVQTDLETGRAVSSNATITPQPVAAYICEALERNPSIQSAMSDARAKLERIPQVTSLPDPMIRSIVRPEPIQTAAGDVYFTLGVSQTIPLLAKLERAGNAAAAETRMALEQLNNKRIRLIADVERAYWQIYLLDRSLEITRENMRLLDDMIAVVDTRYAVGKVQQQDLLRVQTELAKLRDDEKRLVVRRSAAVAAMNQLADQPTQRSIATTTPIDPVSINTDVDRLVALASEHNPELAMLRERIDRDNEQLELAKLGYWPDVSVGFEWSYVDGRGAFIPPVNPMTGVRPPINRKSEAGDDNWAITLQMNLPIWSQRVEAAKHEALHRKSATEAELRSTENMIAFRIFDAWSRTQAQQHTLRVLQSELIPQATQTYEVTLTAYQTGETSFVTLIDNWQRWLDFELMRHRETVDLEIAYSDLQREVGLELLRGPSSATTPVGGESNG